MSAEALETPAKIRILRKMVEVVMWEWNAVQEGRWEELPTYGAKKQDLIDQMKAYDWTPLPMDKENPEVLILESQIVDLEYQVKKMLEARMNVITAQLNDLKRRNNKWRKAVNPYKQTAAMRG
jgi:hypothetical protein